MRVKHTFRLPPSLGNRLAEYATRKRVPQAVVAETALESFLSPDSSEQLEAALSPRLDRLSRQQDRIEQQSLIANEALGLFVRFWLAHTLVLPEAALASQQAKGKERYEGFLAALGRRMAKAGPCRRTSPASPRIRIRPNMAQTRRGVPSQRESRTAAQLAATDDATRTTAGRRQPKE